MDAMSVASQCMQLDEGRPGFGARSQWVAQGQSASHPGWRTLVLDEFERPHRGRRTSAGGRRPTHNFEFWELRRNARHELGFGAAERPPLAGHHALPATHLYLQIRDDTVFGP